MKITLEEVHHSSGINYWMLFDIMNFRIIMRGSQGVSQLNSLYNVN